MADLEKLEGVSSEEDDHSFGGSENGWHNRFLLLHLAKQVVEKNKEIVCFLDEPLR